MEPVSKVIISISISVLVFVFVAVAAVIVIVIICNLIRGWVAMEPASKVICTAPGSCFDPSRVGFQAAPGNRW